nr:EOG090X0424 [Eulimnadia texana]
MASLTDDERKLFPLKTVDSVVSLFRKILTRTTEPDLALLSILVGYVENTLTVPVAATNRRSESEDVAATAVKEAEDFLPLDFDALDELVSSFKAIIKNSVDVYGCHGIANRELVKRVSDTIWNTLTRSYYKDRAHLQHLYSYLTENKLDCFGVALAVTIACQILGLRDVHLAMSEDHAWVTFGSEPSETVEVTWHGKGNEDRRGQSIDAGIQAKSWLYVEGKPVTGTRFTEVAAIVSSINPSVNATTDSIEVAALQQKLLWLLYEMGHISKYPMALGNLADLEELNPTAGSVPCNQLFADAIEVARRCYDNCYVYPYTYQGGYFYRNLRFKEALESWANAADVIRKYNYSREDEEIYKEFFEIANELIPHIMKVEGSGHSAKSVLKDPVCFAHLLRFYDGVCQWEEGSTTPVLHIGWAKPLVNTISKFDAEARSHVIIECSDSDEEVKVDTETSRYKEVDVEYKDANANDVLLEWPEQQRETVEEQQGRYLAPVDLAALTDLCGKTLLSPAFFLGKQPCLVGRHARSSTALICSRKITETEIKRKQGGEEQRPRLRLRSQKMAGLKDLLLSEKLNTQAISLQLTAQSQVQLGGRKVRDELKDWRSDNVKETVSSRPKRLRKD